MSHWVARTWCLLALAVSAASSASGPNFSGLWWTGPGGPDPGSSVAIDHQADVIFAVWMTYDKLGEPTWTFVPRAVQLGPDREGENEDTFIGPRYSARAKTIVDDYFFLISVTLVELRQAGFHLHKKAESTFWWDERASPANENWEVITPYVFGSAAAECVEGEATPSEPNFQGLWWNSPAGSEPGWGIYLAHQDDQLFGAWFGYGAGGEPTWHSLSLSRIGANVYKGIVYSHHRAPPSPAASLPTVEARALGGVTLTFADRDEGEFALWIDDDYITFRKNIERLRFATPPTICRSP